jgi:hypothetical protein
MYGKIQLRNPSVQLDKVTHEITTSGTQRPPTFTVQGYVPMTQPFRTFK